jgi:hypothetical protein
MPSTAKYFFDYFSAVNAENPYIGSWLRYAAEEWDIYEPMKSPTYNFEKHGYTTRLFLYNAADMISAVAMAFLLVPILSIIKLLLPSSVIFKNADNFLRGRLPIILINFSYLKITMLANLNFSKF